MIVAIGIGFIGLLLIYFEFFVPGGILGVLGGLLILGGIALCIWEQSQSYWIFIYILAAVLLIIFTIRLALKRIKQKPAMYASDDQSGYLASKYDQELIGKAGIAVTDLKPSGHIKVDGRQYQVVSENSYIKKGASVKVINGEGARYKVREIRENERIHNG